jgi:integrase
VSGAAVDLLEFGLPVYVGRHDQDVLPACADWDANDWSARPVPDIRTNPTLLVDPAFLTHAKVRPLTVEEPKAVLEVASEDRREAPWVIDLTLGPRQGETPGLGWSHIDFDHNLITIERPLQRQPDGSLAFVPAETERSRRVIPMPSSVAAALRRRTSTTGSRPRPLSVARGTTPTWFAPGPAARLATHRSQPVARRWP